ncbi:MAG: NusG domain II-containing protein [Spirochaetaceae bacterium]|nr:NusG domain II-containing protein [Spirochaetaceae bacterium]
MKIARIAALKPADLGVIGVTLAVTVFSAASVYAGNRAQNRILIEGPQDRWIFPLDHAETLAIPGYLGDTVVELRDSQVRVISSPCGNQTCVAAGPIRSRGQWTACLPNGVLISIDSDAKRDDIDGAVW